MSENHKLTRRHALESMLLLGALAVPAGARTPQRSGLPLNSPGLEHIGLTVTDPEEAAKFYGRIFNPQLFRERDAPPRYYVTAGTSYLAFGGNSTATPRIDHFCALVEDYRNQSASIRKALEEQGVQFGSVGMIGDPDGLRLQLLGVPGGLAGTIIPGGRISLDPPAVHAIALDHITLLVSDLEKSAEFYRKLFGKEASQTTKPARVWFNVANTRLGLESVPAGQKPRVDHFCLSVAGFERNTITNKLKALHVEIAPSNDENRLRFRDPYENIVELKAGA
jgi:catechol 2,3-dioxygenase-like lactoylglutathione lyase family enzyme